MHEFPYEKDKDMETRADCDVPGVVDDNEREISPVFVKIMSFFICHMIIIKKKSEKIETDTRLTRRNVRQPARLNLARTTLRAKKTCHQRARSVFPLS